MDIEVRTETKTVYLGLDGREFATRREALASLIRSRLAEIIGLDQAYYDFDTDTAADAVISHSREVEVLLGLLNDGEVK